MLGIIANSPTYDAPSFLTLLIKSYNDTYDWRRPYSDFFRQPYASQIPQLLNASKGREEIDAVLPHETSALFNPVFYANIKDPNNELVLKLFLTGNSFLNWRPRALPASTTALPTPLFSLRPLQLPTPGLKRPGQQTLRSSLYRAARTLQASKR